MESVPVTQEQSKPTSLSQFLVMFGIFILMFYVAVSREWRLAVYMLIMMSFVVSIYNYELNLAFLIFWLHVAAMLHHQWDVYAQNARFLFLFPFVARAVMRGIPNVVKGKKIGYTNLHLWLFLFAIVVGLSTVDAFMQPLSIYRVISIWWLLIALGMIIWRYIDNREKIITWFKIVVIINTAFFSISLMVGDWFSMASWGALRFKGLYFNPNTVGLISIFHLPASLFLYLYAKRRPEEGNFWRLFFLGAFVIGALCLLLSGSRSSIGGLIIGGAAGVTLYYRSRIMIVGFIFVLLLGAAYFIFQDAIKGRFFQDVIIREETIENYAGREELWNISWELLKKKPLLGYGFGTSDFAISTRGNPELIDYSHRFGSHSHNSLLRCFVEMGVMGTFFIILLVILLPFKFLSLVTRVQSEELLLLLLTCFVIFVAGFANSFFESWLTSVGSALCFLFWLSVLFIYRIDFTPDDFVESGDRPKVKMSL